MKFLKTRFLLAMVLSSARAAASVAGSGNSIALVRAIERGTMLRTRACRDDSPIAASMRRSAASSMPMCRRANSLASSSCARARALCTDIGLSTLFHEFRVIGLVHQLIELGHVLDQDL